MSVDKFLLDIVSRISRTRVPACLPTQMEAMEV